VSALIRGVVNRVTFPRHARSEGRVESIGARPIHGLSELKWLKWTYLLSRMVALHLHGRVDAVPRKGVGCSGAGAQRSGEMARVVAIVGGWGHGGENVWIAERRRRVKADASKGGTEAGGREMVVSFASADIYHERSHHVVGIRRGAKVHWRRKWCSEIMHRAVRRVEGLNIVKVIRDSPHLDHSVTIVSRQALDLGSPGGAVSTLGCPPSSQHNLPVLKPHLYLAWAQAGNLPRQTLSVRCVRMWLFRKLAHEKPGLLMGQPAKS
jgi:hypothetical protein